MFCNFCEKFENSKWPPFLARQKFFQNWDNYSAEIPSGSKISSKSLYLARFSRYKHFCVLQFLRKFRKFKMAAIFGETKFFWKLAWLLCRYTLWVKNFVEIALSSLARIVANTTKYSHITPVRKALHWLPIKYRTIFKTAMLVYKFLHSGNPKYFEPFLIPRHSAYNTRRSQSDGIFLEVPHFGSIFKSRKHFGLSFAYDAPMIWNDLPDEVRSANSLASFRSKLKSYLFGKAYPP